MSEARRMRRRGRLSRRSKVAVAIGLFCVAVGLFGPFFAPYAPTEILGRAYAPPSGEYLLGLDFLGRDVLSRFLWGGRTALTLALLSVLLGYAVGMAIGLVAAYVGGWIDSLLMRVTDIFLAFPGLVFILLLIAAFGSNLPLLVLAVGLAAAPRIARIVRAAALEVVDLPYIEASKARGERPWYIAGREIVPNILSPLGVDFGIRLTGSVLLVAGVSFLGFGLQPPAADWGLMVSENRGGITVQPWTMVAPAVIVGLLTVSLNLFLDDWRGAEDGSRREESLATR